MIKSGEAVRYLRWQSISRPRCVLMSKQLIESRNDDALEQYNDHLRLIWNSPDTPTKQDADCTLGSPRSDEFVNRRSNVHPGEPITELGQRLVERPPNDLAAAVLESVLITSSITIPSERWIQPRLIIDRARFTPTVDSPNVAPTEVTA